MEKPCFTLLKNNHNSICLLQQKSFAVPIVYYVVGPHLSYPTSIPFPLPIDLIKPMLLHLQGKEEAYSLYYGMAIHLELTVLTHWSTCRTSEGTYTINIMCRLRTTEKVHVCTAEIDYFVAKFPLHCG